MINNLNRIHLQWFTEEGEPGAYVAQFPDHLKKNEYLGGFKTLGELGDDVVAMKAKYDAIETPPKTAGEYEFNAVDLPDGLEGKEEGEKAFREMAIAAKLNKTQAKVLYSQLQQMAITKYGKDQQIEMTKKEEAKTARDKLTAGLKTEWGNDYPVKVELAKRAMKAFADEDFHKVLEETLLPDGTKLGDSSGMIKAMVRVAEKIGEDQLGPGAPGAPPKGESAVLNERYPSMKDMPDRNEG